MADDTNGFLTRRRALAGIGGALGLGAAGLYLTADTAADVEDYAADFTVQSGASEGLGVDSADRPVLGSTDADLRLFAWSDYQCPYCRRFDEETLPELAASEVADGTVAVVFLELPLLGERSLTAGVVSKAVWRTVRDDDPNAWGRFHRFVFTKQGPENGEWATESNLLSYAGAVDGVPGDDPADEEYDEEHRQREEEVDGDGVEPAEPVGVPRRRDSQNEQYEAEAAGDDGSGSVVGVDEIGDDHFQ